VSIGVIAAQSGTVSVVPAFGLTVSRVRLSATFRGDSDSESDTLGRVNLGVGIVLNARFSIVPGVAIPFGMDGAETVFQVGAVVSLPR
jgi:hypothetical protein